MNTYMLCINIVLFYVRALEAPGTNHTWIPRNDSILFSLLCVNPIKCLQRTRLDIIKLTVFETQTEKLNDMQGITQLLSLDPTAA